MLFQGFVYNNFASISQTILQAVLGLGARIGSRRGQQWGQFWNPLASALRGLVYRVSCIEALKKEFSRSNAWTCLIYSSSCFDAVSGALRAQSSRTRQSGLLKAI